jgi:hypothetical protein
VARMAEVVRASGSFRTPADVRLGNMRNLP